MDQRRLIIRLFLFEKASDDNKPTSAKTLFYGGALKDGGAK